VGGAIDIVSRFGLVQTIFVTSLGKALIGMGKIFLASGTGMK